MYVTQAHSRDHNLPDLVRRGSLLQRRGDHCYISEYFTVSHLVDFKSAKMVQGPSVSALEALRAATSPTDQIAALKQLKNSIIGHDQRKELAIRHSALEPLVRILTPSTAKPTGKRRRSSTTQALPPWSREDEVRVQAVQILASIAGGGAAFVSPLLAAGVPEVLLRCLSLDVAPRLTTAILKALKSIATAWASSYDTASQPPAEFLPKGSTAVLNSLLHQDPTSTASQQHVTLVAEIISLAAQTTVTRSLLTSSGILDTLAALVASHAIHSGTIPHQSSPTSLPPPPATLPSILAAIATIITGSPYRAHRFVLSDSIRSLFLHYHATHNGLHDQRQLFSTRHNNNSSAHQPQHPQLLPTLHIPASGSTSYNNTSSRAFPAMQSLQHTQPRRRGPSHTNTTAVLDADHANAVCGYLLYLSRDFTLPQERLVALRLLALVHNALNDDILGQPKPEHTLKFKERERQIALLAIPPAVALVRTASEAKAGEVDSRVKEEASEVLALLTRSSKELQLAAVDAGALKYLCPLLKKSFDHVPLAKPMWSANATSPNGTTGSSDPTCVLGPRGLPQEIQHAQRCRRGALLALAALAEKEDAHRKAIVDAGVVVCVVDALVPFPASTVATASAKDSATGNSVPVLLAACTLAKTLARSVSLLRTSLIDAGIAKPIFALLSHEDETVQFAATECCVNLLLEFSPVREDLVREGVVEKLVQRVRGEDKGGLRLSSLWALKHLVLGGSREMKLGVLDGLGGDWITGAIQGSGAATAETGVEGRGGGVALSTPNAAGEQVDLLNPEGDGEDDTGMDVDDDGEVLYDESSSTHYQASSLRSTLPPLTHTQSHTTRTLLSALRHAEHSPLLAAQRADLLLQEQALDFLRNLLNGDDCAALLDHLLTTLGTSQFFALLHAKLAPMSSKTGSKTGGVVVYPPTELILSAVNILTHIANASPVHKTLLTSQTSLLTAWLPHFSHADRRVRVMSLWAVCSLTWIEDEGDRAAARQRGEVLRRTGIEAAVRGLAGDSDTDCRERVRTAVRQIDGL